MHAIEDLICNLACGNIYPARISTKVHHPSKTINKNTDCCATVYFKNKHLRLRARGRDSGALSNCIPASSNRPRHHCRMSATISSCGATSANSCTCCGSTCRLPRSRSLQVCNTLASGAPRIASVCLLLGIRDCLEALVHAVVYLLRSARKLLPD